MPIRLSQLATLLPLAALAACSRPTLKLAPGDSATFNVSLQAGFTQMVEVDLARVTKPGAELGFSAGGVLLPPIYMQPAGRSAGGAPAAMASFLWSREWPVDPKTPILIANYGPGEANILAVRVHRGDERALFERTRQWRPLSPLGWFDLRELMDRAPLPKFEGPETLLTLESTKEFAVQPRRREAFKAISGLPLALRLAGNAIPAGVEVRACALEGGGAVVGFSRADNPFHLKHFGPGWLPPASEARWNPFPSTPGWTRGFEVKETVFSLAMVVGSAGGDGAVMLKLFRIDSVEPIAVKKVERLAPEGTWVEFKFAQPIPPGDWVLQAQAIEGAPAWLGWNREAKQAPGSDWPEITETLVGMTLEAGVRLDTYIPVQTLLTGSAFSVEKMSGRSPLPAPVKPGAAGDGMMIDARLFPGDTEIYYLRDYRMGGLSAAP